MGLYSSRVNPAIVSRQEQRAFISIYYALVESVRTAAGPRQHVVAYLGELNHDQQGRWQRTVVIDNRQGDSQQLRRTASDLAVYASQGGHPPPRKTRFRLLVQLYQTGLGTRRVPYERFPV